MDQHQPVLPVSVSIGGVLAVRLYERYRRNTSCSNGLFSDLQPVSRNKLDAVLKRVQDGQHAGRWR